MKNVMTPKSFRVISDEKELNKLLDDLGCEGLPELFKKSKYQLNLEKTISLIESAYKTDYIQDKINSLIELEEQACINDMSGTLVLGFNESYKRCDISVSELVIKDYLQYIYDYLEDNISVKTITDPLGIKPDEIVYDSKPYEKLNIRNFGCVYDFSFLSENVLKKFGFELHRILFEDFIAEKVKIANENISALKKDLDNDTALLKRLESSLSSLNVNDKDFKKSKESKEKEIQKLQNEIRKNTNALEIDNKFVSNVHSNEDLLKEYNKYLKKTTISRYADIEVIRDLYKKTNKSSRLICDAFEKCFMVCKFIQIIIHLKEMKSIEPRSLEVTTILNVTNKGKPLADKSVSSLYKFTEFVLTEIVENYNDNSYMTRLNEFVDIFCSLSCLMNDVTIVMHNAKINMSSYSKKSGLLIDSDYLKKLFFHWLKNTGVLKNAALHMNSTAALSYSKKLDRTLNDNIIYTYDIDDKCYRYFDIDNQLNIFETKITNLILFSKKNGSKDSDSYIYDVIKRLRRDIKTIALEECSYFKLRDSLNYTAFIVDNGTIIMKKDTGEFIFCENLFSERVITFRKFNGAFDKFSFEHNYNSMDNMLSKYVIHKIKYGVNLNGTLNKELYSFLCACILNLFQHDIDTQTAVMILGQNGSGKSLLLQALTVLDSPQMDSNISSTFALEDFAEKFGNRAIEKYQTIYNSEFSVKKYNDNAPIKKAIERTMISVEEKFKDRVTVEINAKGLFVGEELIRVKFDGGLKQRIVVFYMKDNADKIDIDGLSDITDFLAYDITSTLCGLYDGFRFQYENGVFESVSTARIYADLFKIYNPKAYNEFTDSVTNVGGVDIITEIDKFGLLNISDLSKVMQIADNSKINSDISSVKKETLDMYLRRICDYNKDKDSKIYNKLDFSTWRLDKVKGVTLQRTKYSFGIKFKDKFLYELLDRLKLEPARNKTDIEDLENIIKRCKYNVNDIKYMLKKFKQIITSVSEKDLEDFEQSQEETKSVLLDALASVKETINDSKTLSTATHQDKQDLLN
jgi:energy-coupling factor transporter ATP-binding protein EcfA2